MTETLTLPVLPLDDIVVLPGMVVPVRLAEPEVRAAIDAARASDSDDARVLLVPRLAGKYAAVGTVATVEQVGQLPGGEPAAVVRGVSRVRIGTGATGPGAALWVQATVQDEPAVDEQATGLARDYKALAVSILQQRGAWQFVDNVQSITDPSALADLAGYAPYLTSDQKVWLLETVNVSDRLERLVTWSREHLAELDVAETIRKDVQEGMDKQQREFLLRQQLAAIRKELAGLDRWQARLRGGGLPGPDRGRPTCPRTCPQGRAQAEAAKLERGSDQSPEAGWIRTWLDTVLEMPWNDHHRRRLRHHRVRRAVLDADHAGLDDVKDRIVEYLAVRKSPGGQVA